MRKQALSKLALCALLCVPAFALRGDDIEELRERLSRTVNSLATFNDIGHGLIARAPRAVNDLLAASEAGPADAALAESQLTDLRTRVNALQEILDARAVWAGAPASAPEIAEPIRASFDHPGGFASSTTAASGALGVAGSKVAFETEDFVADRARLGRACWRGGHYLEGVAALEPLAGEPKADYWRARCLEKLARNSEALELYKRVIEIAGDSPEGRSAREDREFLEWSIGHGLVDKP